MNASSSDKEEKLQKAKKKYEKKLGFALAGMVVFICLVFYAYQLLLADNFLINQEKKVLYIYPGSTFENVRDTLEKGFLHDRLSFIFLSKLSGYQEKIIPGRYEIAPNASNYEVLKRLIKGRQTPVKLTFNNIRTTNDLAGKLSKKLALDSIQLLQAITNPTIAKKYNLNDTTLICLFQPNTYEVLWTISADDLIEKMHQSYSKFWSKDRLSKAESIGLTPEQVITLASIVQAESIFDSERPRIAGVYLNRLRKGQRLQADPTLIFAGGDFSVKRATSNLLWIESPYNTYRKKGLPPGPINLPETSSIDAVLNYEKHDYFYFCAKSDFSGYHQFSKDFNSHVETANAYRSALDQAGIH